MDLETKTRVCIYGAGSIGCYVGGRLQAEGLSVSYVGRPRIAEQLSTCGLHLSDWQGASIDVAPDTLDFHTSDDVVRSADLVIVTVKSAATEEVGRALADKLAPDAVVMSLQNGVGNADRMAQYLPNNRVLSGMISFNVVQQGDGRFHAGSEGELMCEGHPLLKPLLPVFRKANLPLELRNDMLQVQWAKLLMNLNNSLNALSGIPLLDELSQRDFRRCLSLMISEALLALDQAGIQPAKLLPIPMPYLPLLLRLPDWLFRRLAKQMLAIDPLARSSMWEDLEAGRKTEADWINGEVIRLGQSCNVDVPVNERVIELIRIAEDGGERNWSASALLVELEQAGAR